MHEDTSVQLESIITYFDVMFNVVCNYKREFDQSLNHKYNNRTVGITLKGCGGITDDVRWTKNVVVVTITRLLQNY